MLPKKCHQKFDNSTISIFNELENKRINITGKELRNIAIDYFKKNMKISEAYIFYDIMEQKPYTRNHYYLIMIINKFAYKILYSI
jgi:hypothetical protein